MSIYHIWLQCYTHDIAVKTTALHRYHMEFQSQEQEQDRDSSRQHLRSANSHQLYVQRYRRIMLGRRSFSVAGPKAWNTLIRGQGHRWRIRFVLLPTNKSDLRSAHCTLWVAENMLYKSTLAKYLRSQHKYISHFIVTIPHFTFWRKKTNRIIITPHPLS